MLSKWDSRGFSYKCLIFSFISGKILLSYSTIKFKFIGKKVVWRMKWEEQTGKNQEMWGIKHAKHVLVQYMANQQNKNQRVNKSKGFSLVLHWYVMIVLMVFCKCERSVGAYEYIFGHCGCFLRWLSITSLGYFRHWACTRGRRY